MKVVCLVVLVCLAAAPAARADAWRPVRQSCLSADGSGGQCAVAHSGATLNSVLVAPGGTTAYVISSEDAFVSFANALLIFDRDPVTGALTQRAGRAGCISQDSTEGECDLGRMVGGRGSMALSPDGHQLYVLGSAGVVVFDVLAGGALQQKACVSNDGSDGSADGVCTDARGMQGPLSELALSPDGKSLYVGGAQLAAFSRNPASGVLTQLPGRSGCVAPGAVDGCADVAGFSFGVQLAISPDGRSLYAPGEDTGVVVFSRDLASGALTQRAFDANGIPGALAALVGPDGHQVYLSTDDGVYTLARAADGSLAFQSCINDDGSAGCRDGTQMLGLGFSAISPDGQDLVVGSEGGGIAVLARDPATGELTQRAGADACVNPDGSGGCLADPLSTEPGHITFGSDSQFYAGGSRDAALIVYKRDFYPVCASLAAPVPHDAATSLPLDCSDRNGDPLSLRISAAPASGTLGGIDPATHRVTYSPFAGFAGPDAFRYQALAAGLASAEATVSLSVAPGGPVPAPAGPIDADHDGFFSGQDCDDHNPAIHPGAREVRGNKRDENCDGLAEALPTLALGLASKWRFNHTHFTLTQLTISAPPRGAKLEVRCAGKGCPFKRRRVAGKVRHHLLNALPSLHHKVHFRAKQTLQVRISKPGFNTKVAQLRLRAGRIPTTVPLCLPPGASHPQPSCT